MSEDQAALQSGVGVHRRRILHQVHHSPQDVEAHSADGVGKALPLSGDVGHLELQFSRCKPGIWSLGPEVAELDLALPGLLLLGATAAATAITRLLEILVVSNGSQHIEEGICAVHTRAVHCVLTYFLTLPKIILRVHASALGPNYFLPIPAWWLTLKKSLSVGHQC